MASPTLLNVYPQENYQFGEKPAVAERSAEERLARRERRLAAEGARRTVSAVMLVHSHGHPHVLLLQQAGGLFALPGGRLKPGEGAFEALQRKLRSKLCPTSAALAVRSFDVGELLAVWHRPHLDSDAYPYPLPHVAREAETNSVYLVRLPEKCFLAVPSNWKLVAVPLIDLHRADPRFSSLLAALPAVLSRFTLNNLDA